MTANLVRQFVLPALLVALPAMAASVDSALLALVPQDSAVIAGARVDDVRNSPFGQFVLRNMQLDSDEFRKFMDETGFDPRRDLREIVMATLPSAAGTGDRTILVGKGVFNPAKIIAAAKRAGGETSNYMGVEIITHKTEMSSGAVAFMDPGLAIAGDSALVKQAIERRGKGVAISAATQRKVVDISSQNHVWFYSSVSPASLFSGHVTDPNLGATVQGGLIESVTAAQGGLSFDAKGVKVQGEASTRSDKDASALADVFRFLAGIVVSKEPDAKELLQSLNVTSDGSTMKMTLLLPETMLENLFGNGGAKARTRRVKAEVID